MSERKIVVPEGMLKAADHACFTNGGNIRYGIEAALRWLSENPMVPTVKQTEPICELWNNNRTRADFHENYNVFIIREWAKRMFLSSEPEVPEEIHDLLDNGLRWTKESHERSVIEAFRRGQKAGSK